ncbi:MAG: hypothetical protein PHH60_04565, partial [Candidatus Margulisbacteria bacterium]|nr:hypothetical protein [Candidatus Margulisiibacteriota bacterium]
QCQADCRQMTRFLLLSALLHLAAVPFLSLLLDQAQKTRTAAVSPVHHITLVYTPEAMIESLPEDLPSPAPAPQPSQPPKETKVKIIPAAPQPDIAATTGSAPSAQPQPGLVGEPLTVDKAGQYLSGLSAGEKQALVMNGGPGLPKKKLPLAPIKGPGNIFKSSITVCTDNIDNDHDGPKDFNDPDCAQALLDFNRSVWELKQIVDATSQ